MAEVLLEFEGAVRDGDGRLNTARVCGRETDRNGWEGWIEFDALDGSAVLRTSRETTQPDRAKLVYWATGLTRAYLEGALQRARNPLRISRPFRDPQSTFPGPAPAFEVENAAPVAVRTRAVLDPFEVRLQGEGVLRQELAALNADHLRDIIRAYRLAAIESDLLALTPEHLRDIIMAAVIERG